MDLLTTLLSIVLERVRMPEEWRISFLVPVFKNKDVVPWDKAYRIEEKVVEAMLRREVMSSN